MEPPADALVHALKYEGWVELAPLMAQAMCEQELPWLVSSGPVLVVPMPTTPARERKRGYNQAERLARGISETRGWPLVPALRRTGTGPTQVSLPASRRWANVRSAFEVEDGTTHRLTGARVVLVDDVLTTGSTACAAALVLARAGTAQVNLVTYARAISFRPVGR